MNQIIKKNRRKIFLILVPLFITIYQVYLWNRIWDFPQKINLVIGIVSWIILYFAFYFFDKKIKYKEIKKKNVTKIFIASIALTLVVLGMNFDLFTKKYTESTVEISNHNQSIPIKTIMVDHTPKEATEEQKNAPILTLNFEKCKDIVIVFEKNSNHEVITIKDGKHVREINLYSYKDDIYQYKVESNKTMELFSVFRLFLSFIMLEIISLMFCIASYYLYQKEKSLILPTLFLIFIMQAMFYQENVSFTRYNDTYDYETEYTAEQILHGELQGRVPLYPVIIQISKLIFGEGLWSNFLCIGQIIVSFISLIYLYKTLKLLVKWEGLRVLITFLYGVSIAVIGWNNALLTESLALSSTIFFCYLMISYLKKEKLKYGIQSVILIFIMTFLRPSFIGFVAILLAFFIVRMLIHKKQRKKDSKCLLATLMVIAIIFGYAIAYYKQHDIFSISKVSVRQDLYVCMEQGFYKNSGDEEFIRVVESNIEESKNKNEVFFLAMERVQRQYGNKRIQELVKQSKKASKLEYLNYLIHVINKESKTNFNSYHTLCINDTENIRYNFIKTFNFLNFSTVYLIVILEGFVALYRWLKNKKPDWISLGIFGFLVTILVTTFLGTNAEFMRTAICVIPFSYIAIGTLASDCIEKYKRQGMS